MNIRNFFQVPDAVSIWYSYVQGGSEETAFLQILDNARAAFPDITIAEVFINFNDIFNQYEAYVGSGIGPDLIILPNDNLGNWARNGYVEDITSLLSGHLGSFTQTAIDGMKVDGQLYGVPESAKAVGLYYNKSRIPTPPTTTAGLLSLVQGGKKLALQRGGGVYFDFGLYYAFGGKLQNASGRCVAEQGGVIPTMKYLLALKTAGANVTDDYGQLGGAFMNGTIDMIFDGPWAYMDYKNALGSNLGVALLPAGPGGASKPLNGIDGYSANPNSLDIPTAVDVALFLTNQANSQIMTNYGGHVPIRTDVTSSDPLLNIFAQVSAAGLARPQTEQFGNYWGPFSQMYSDVFDGSVIPANGVIKACVEMNNLNGFSSYFTFSPLLRR